MRSFAGLGRIIGRRRSENGDDQWIAVSDLMAGLMIIFLFIAITHIRYVEQSTPHSTGVAGDANTNINSENRNSTSSSSNRLSAEDELIASWLKSIDSKNWGTLVAAVKERQRIRAEQRAADQATAQLSVQEQRQRQAAERLLTPSELRAERRQAAELRRETARENRDAGRALRSLLDPSQAENIEIYTALATVLRLEQKRLAEEVRTERNLISVLKQRFSQRLTDWNAEIDSDKLVVRFKSPETLFEARSSDLKDRFKVILQEFIPEYIQVLSQFQNHIDEVRIEGHSSSEWADAVSDDDAFFKNLELSQGRARSTAEYALSLPLPKAARDWVRQRLTTVGLSSSRPIVVDGVEDRSRSRRVEFRVQTTAREKAENILETLDDAIKTRKFLDPQK